MDKSKNNIRKRSCELFGYINNVQNKVLISDLFNYIVRGYAFVPYISRKSENESVSDYVYYTFLSTLLLVLLMKGMVSALQLKLTKIDKGDKKKYFDVMGGDIITTLIWQIALIVPIEMLLKLLSAPKFIQNHYYVIYGLAASSVILNLTFMDLRIRNKYNTYARFNIASVIVQIGIFYAFAMAKMDILLSLIYATLITNLIFINWKMMLKSIYSTYKKGYFDVIKQIFEKFALLYMVGNLITISADKIQYIFFNQSIQVEDKSQYGIALQLIGVYIFGMASLIRYLNIEIFKFDSENGDVFEKGYRNIIIYIIASEMCAILIGDYVIKLIYGDMYVRANTYLILLIPAVTIQYLTAVHSAILQKKGALFRIQKISALQLILIFLINYLFIEKYGVWIMIVSIAIGNTFGYFIMTHRTMQLVLSVKLKIVMHSLYFMQLIIIIIGLAVNINLNK
jgi:O-antigen/teichoic acid export membrane protein